MDTLNVLLGLSLFLPDPSFTYYTKSFEDHETYNPEHLEKKNTIINVDSVPGMIITVARHLDKCTSIEAHLNLNPGSTRRELHCSPNYTSTDCMIEVFDEFSPYLKEGEGKKIQQIYNSRQLELYDFIRKGKENWIESFFDNGGFDCLTRNKDVIERCERNEMFTLIPEVIAKARDGPSYSLEEIFCRYTFVYAKCVRKYTSTCESKKAISLLRELQDVRMNLKACRGQGLMSGSATVRSTLLQYILSTVLVLLLNKLRKDLTLFDIFV